jgi:hypothetical protein
MKFFGSHQLHRISILVSALALMLSITPKVVQAQTNQAIETATLTNVKLSAQQKAHVTQLIETTRSQILSFLTPAQQRQFQAALRGDTSFDAAFAAMKLSQQQQTKLQKVLSSSQQQAEAVLTRKQFLQVRKNLENYVERQKI